LDRRDLGGTDAVDRGDARAGGDAIDMDGARSAKRHAAAEFGAGHAEHVAQDPQERSVVVDVDCPIDAIDLDRDGHRYLRLPACSGQVKDSNLGLLATRSQMSYKRRFRTSPETTPVRRIGFVVSPGFQVLSFAVSSVFELANFVTGEPVYEVRLL